MDQDRHTIDKLYLDTATLAWNGNPVDGIVPIKVNGGYVLIFENKKKYRCSSRNREESCCNIELAV